MGSWCGFRMWTSRPIRGCCCPIPDEVQALVVRQLGATALFAAKFRENAARSLLLPKRRPGHARAALAAAQARRRSAGGRVAVRIVPGPARNLPRVPARLLRHAGARRDAGRRPQPEDPRRDRRLRDAVAVRGVAALQLRRQLSLRRRRAAGRAPRAGAGRRSGAAARAARRRRAARAARRRVDGRDRAAAPAARSAVSRQERRRRPRHAAGDRRSHRRGAARARPSRRRSPRAPAPRSSRRAPRPSACASPASRATSRSKTRRAIATRSACRCRRHSRIAAAAGRAIRSAISRCATRGRTRRSPPPTSPRGTGSAAAGGRSGADAARGGRAPRRRRVPSRRHAARVDRRRRAAHAAPPLARQAAARDRAGRSGGARPVHDDVAGRREAAARRRRAARRHRAAAGRAAAGVDSRNRDPAGAHRRLRPRRSRRRDRGRRRSSGSASSRSASATAASRCIWRIICRGCCRPNGPPAAGPPEGGPTPRPVRRQPDVRRTAAIDRARPRSSNICARAARRSSGRCTTPVGGGYPAETVDALWNLVWQGLVTNDTFHALRAFTRARAPRRRAKRAGRVRVSIAAPGAAVGRRPMVSGARRSLTVDSPSRDRRPPRRPTKWAAAVAQQLLARHGVLTREAVMAESIPGGFGSVYPVLKAMEESGRLRRGYFVAGLGATQFALPGALDLLRSLRDAPMKTRSSCVLAATDPANPYAPRRDAEVRPPAFPPGFGARRGRGPTRTVGATVILVDGALAAYLARGDRQLLVFLPDAEPQRSKAGRAIARALIDRARAGRRLAARHADRGDRRRARPRAPARAVSRRSRLHRRRDGISARFVRGHAAATAG